MHDLPLDCCNFVIQLPGKTLFTRTLKLVQMVYESQDENVKASLKLSFLPTEFNEKARECVKQVCKLIIVFNNGMATRLQTAAGLIVACCAVSA